MWTQLVSGEHQPYLAELGCEGTLLRLTGALAGVQQGDIGVPSGIASVYWSFGLKPYAVGMNIKSSRGPGCQARRYFKSPIEAEG